MAKSDLKDRIGEAVTELRCIAEIMAELGANAMQDNAMVPASWMIWLGACVSSATERTSDAIEAIDKPAQSETQKRRSSQRI